MGTRRCRSCWRPSGWRCTRCSTPASGPRETSNNPGYRSITEPAGKGFGVSRTEFGMPRVRLISLPAVDLHQRRDLYNGFGDTLANAFELVFTPVVAGFLGFLLDRFVGTTPVFTVVFGVLALIGVVAKMYYTYLADMEAHEARLFGTGPRDDA